MNEYLKLLLVGVAAFIALYFNILILIFIVGIIYGLITDWSISKASFISFLLVFCLWSLLIVIRDIGFHHSPTGLMSAIAGGIPTWLIPIGGGLVGGLITFFSVSGSSLLRNRSGLTSES